jgi:gliding motility-associated-like protein
LDDINRAVKTQTSYLGLYQLRAAARATSLSLDSANVFPRVFSPNGDGFNDKVYIVLENPNGADVTSDIFDMAGRHVAKLLPPTAVSGVGTTLSWDGKDSSGGRVPSGVYIYKVQGEGKTFTGNVVVAR